MWTPEKAARLAELEAGFSGRQMAQQEPAPMQPQMGTGARLLRGMANTPAHLLNMGQAIGDTLLGTETPNRQIFNVPEAQTTGEAVTDFVGQLPAELIGLATGAGAASKGLRILGAGKRVAPVLGEAVAGAASGLRTSGEEAAMQAGEFGVMGGIMQALAKRNPLSRALLAGASNVGVGAAGQAVRGNDLTSPEALKQMAVMGLLPMAQEGLGAAGRRLLRRAEPTTVTANIDEVMSPNAPLALEGRRLMLEGPSAYGQSATDRRFRTIDEPYIPEQGVIPMGHTEPKLLNDPAREGIVSTAIMTPQGPVRGAFPNAPHPLILMDALEKGLSETDYPRHLGFMSRKSDGSERFVDRAEGNRIANFARQTKTNSPKGELQSENLELISPPNTTGAAPTMLRSGEPASSGGRGLKPLGRSQSGAVNPMLLAPLAGAGVGAISDPENPIQGALVGAGLGLGIAKGGKFLRGPKITQAADLEMVPGKSTFFGRVARGLEKNLNYNKDELLKSLDVRARGEGEYWAKINQRNMNAAGEFAFGRGLTAAQKDAGKAYIASKGDPMDSAALRRAGVPPEFQQYLESAKDAEKQMQGILMRAESDPRKQMLIANTFGTYQTRQFRNFLDDPNFKLDDALKPAALAEWKQHPMFKDIDPAALDEEVLRDFNQHVRELGESGGDYARMDGEGKSRISKALYTSRKDLDKMPAYRKFLGEVTDPFEAQILTTNKLLQSVTQAKLYGDMLHGASDSNGNRFSMSPKQWQDAVAAAKASRDTAKLDFLTKRFVKAPDSPGVGGLAGQMVQRQVADHLQFSGHEGIKSGNGSWYAALNSIPKAVFTRLNPSAWAHNYGQAVLQGHALGIWNPNRIIKTARRMSNDPAVMDELTRSGVIGGHAGRHEFGQMANRLSESGSKGFKDRMKAVMGAINEGYGKPDTWIRATAYLDELDKGTAKGLNREQARLKALEFVNKYSIDYGQVNRLVGRARNTPVVSPFVSYSTETARIIKNLATDVVTGNDRMMESAGALMSLFALPAMLAYAAKELGLSESEKKELASIQDIMPPYMRSRLNATFHKDEKGEFKSFNLGPWMPAGDFVAMAKNILNADSESLVTNNPISSLSGTPLLNMGAEILTGKDLVTGRENRGMSRLLNPVKKNVIPTIAPGGYRYEQIKKAFTPNEDGGFGIEEPSGRKITPGNAIAGALGFGTSSVSTKRLLRRVDAEAKQDLSNAQREASQILQSNAAPAVKESVRREFQQKRERILLRRKQAIEGVR